MNRLNQVDFTLDDLLEEFSQERPKNPYADFSLLSNPFPTAWTILRYLRRSRIDKKRICAQTTRFLSRLAVANYDDSW